MPRENAVPFGFRDVRDDEKSGMVRSVFDSVAGRYDLMNDLMSGGVHRLWKNAMMDRIKPRAGTSLLDVGGGTGDLAFKFLDRGGDAVTVCDINHSMLEVGRDRAIDRGIIDNITWVCGDAENLPLPDSSVEAYATAFCFRNVTHLEDAVRDAWRVLSPGGRFFCLEFSHVVLPALAQLYDTYSFRVLPALGQAIANDRDSYQYLVESIRRFPRQDAFEEIIQGAGFEQTKVTNLSGGIAAIHEGWRL